MKKLLVFLLSFALILCLGSCSRKAASIGIIGGADGPTAIFITSNVNWQHICGLLGIILMAILIARIIYRNRNKK